MKKHLVVLAVLCVAAFAEYDLLWEQEEVGLPQSVYVVGVENTDIDPQPELIYRGNEPDDDNYCHIWALDLLTGQVEEVTDEFYYVYTEPGMEPRLVDVNDNGVYEILFLGQVDPGEYAAWYLFGQTIQAATNGGTHSTPRKASIGQNVPNPLSRSTKIVYAVPNRTRVRIGVYDVSGRLVRRMDQGEVQSGEHVAVWKRDDDQGRPVPAGAYYYVLEVDGSETVRKALVVE